MSQAKPDGSFRLRSRALGTITRLAVNASAVPRTCAISLHLTGLEIVLCGRGLFPISLRGLSGVLALRLLLPAERQSPLWSL